MADERDDVLELKPDEAIDGIEPGENGGEPPEDDGEETVIGFEGEEAAPASESDNSVIRDLRKVAREQSKRIAELERGNAPKVVEVGEKPSLEACDYDEDRFEQALTAWHQRKAQAETQEAERTKREEADREAWQSRIQAFETGKTRLGVADFDDAEAEVRAALPIETQAVIMATDKSAELFYALARSPAKLADLSKLNTLQAALAIGELKGKLQVTKRKLPDPDRPVIGNAAQGSADKHLAKLEKEAEASGNRSELIAYKAKLKSRAN
jgi:hypothetical protein